MARMDEASRVLSLTVVVYGAPRSGKTSILHCIQDRVAPERRTGLAPLGSDSGVAPLLDWLPLDLGVISGWNANVHLYAIPDQRHADSTRRVILGDADGVLFAADSQANRMGDNIEALRSLRSNLDDADGLARQIPTVFLYTKHDLPDELRLSHLAMNEELNPTDAPSFSVSALRGEGVLEALHATITTVMRKLVGPGTRPG